MLNITELAEMAARALELAGIVAVVLGVVIATARSAHTAFRDTDSDRGYRGYRRGIARAVLLGLEFLVAADIIRTVAIEPTLRNVGVLGIIVLIRTFLSMTLEVEIEGRWPWQQAPTVTKRSQPGST